MKPTLKMLLRIEACPPHAYNFLWVHRNKERKRKRKACSARLSTSFTIHERPDDIKVRNLLLMSSYVPVLAAFMSPLRTGGAYRQRLSSFRAQRCDVCCTDASCPFRPETGSCLSAGNGLIQQQGEFLIGAYWYSLCQENLRACEGLVGMGCGVAVWAFVPVCVLASQRFTGRGTVPAS